MQTQSSTVSKQDDTHGLLSPEFLRKLERLELVSRKVLIGRLKGERRSKRKGQSVEFADYRDYVPGDDLRFLDWNIYGRLDRLFIKLFLEEEDLHFHVLVDVSESMAYGNPPKLRMACQFAAALAFVGLIGQDRVAVHAITDGIAATSGALRGRRSVLRLLDFLGQLRAQAPGNLTLALRRFAATRRTPGIVLVISDFLDKYGYETGLRYLLATGMDVHVIQLLAWEELDPPLRGDLRLIDMEDGDEVDVTISAPLLEQYRRRVRGYCGALERWCLGRDISYLLAVTTMSPEELVLQHFRRVGLLR